MKERNAALSPLICPAYCQYLDLFGGTLHRQVEFRLRARFFICPLFYHIYIYIYGCVCVCVYLYISIYIYEYIYHASQLIATTNFPPVSGPSGLKRSFLLSYLSLPACPSFPSKSHSTSSYPNFASESYPLFPMVPSTKVYSIQHAVYSVQYTIYGMQYTVYSIQYTAYTIQYSVYNVEYIANSVQCIVERREYVSMWYMVCSVLCSI